MLHDSGLDPVRLAALAQLGDHTAVELALSDVHARPGGPRRSCAWWQSAALGAYGDEYREWFAPWDWFDYEHALWMTFVGVDGVRRASESFCL